MIDVLAVVVATILLATVLIVIVVGALVNALDARAQHAQRERDIKDGVYG